MTDLVAADGNFSQDVFAALVNGPPAASSDVYEMPADTGLAIGPQAGVFQYKVGIWQGAGGWVSRAATPGL